MFSVYDTRKRKEINDQLCQLIGKIVTGQYMGQPYTGLAHTARGITTKPYDIELAIQIAHPLTVFSHTRQAGENILITAVDLINAHNGQKIPTTIDAMQL